MEDDDIIPGVPGGVPTAGATVFRPQRPTYQYSFNLAEPIDREFVAGQAIAQRDYEAQLGTLPLNSPERFQFRFETAYRSGLPMSMIRQRTEEEKEAYLQIPYNQRPRALEYTPIALRELTPEALAYKADEVQMAKDLNGFFRDFGLGGIQNSGLQRELAFLNLQEALWLEGFEEGGQILGVTIGPLSREQLTRAQIAQIKLDHLRETAESMGLLGQFVNSTTMVGSQWIRQLETSWQTTAVGAAAGGAVGFWTGPGMIGTALAGAKVGFTTGTIADSVGQSIGNAYGEYTQYVDLNGVPLDRDTAQATAVVAGTMIGVIDAFGLSKVLERMPAFKGLDASAGVRKMIDGLLSTEAGRTGLQKSASALRDMFISGSYEGVTEVLQEVIQLAGGEVVAKKITQQEFEYKPASEWFQRMWDSGTVAFFGTAGVRGSMSVSSIPVQSMHSRMMDRSTRHAEQEVNRLEAAVNRVAESGLADKPDVVRNIVNEVTATDNEGGSQTVTLTGEDLNQLAEDNGTDVLTVLTELNVDPNEAENAQTQGTDVNIPVGDFVANGARLRKANPDLIDGLLSKVRYLPDAMSREEAALWRKLKPKERNKEVSTKAADTLKGAKKGRALKLLQARIQIELDATQRFGRSINKYYSQLTAQAYFRIAEREGISINQAFDENPLKIVAEPIIRNNVRDGYAQPIEDARDRGFEAQTEAEAIEFLEAEAAGLDTSPEAARQRAQEAGFDTEMPVYRGLSRTQNYVVDPKEGEGFQDVRTMRPEGKHRHISVTSNEKMVNDWIDRDQDTGKKRKDTDAGKATVFKMFMRGKLLDLMDKVQRARFREELMNVLVADERRYKNLIRDIADVFETLPDAMRQKIAKIAVEFAATRPEVDMSDIDATTTQGFRTLLTRMGSVATQATVDNDNLPMVAQAMDAMHGELVRFQNSRAANNLTSNQMLGLIELTNTVLKLKDLSRGRELAIFDHYNPVYIGSAANRMIQFDERMTDLDKSDKKNNWQQIEPMAHYIEAAGYDIYKQTENGSDTYGVVRPENLRSVNAQFDPDRIDSDDLLAQQQRTAQDKKSKRKAPRGLYSPSTNTISLLKDANLTTFLHELGHHFLEVYTKRAATLIENLRAGTKLTEGQREMMQDINDLIYQLAEQTNQTIPDKFALPLDWWNTLSFDERVSMHEKYADMNEAYWMTGKPPTMSLWDMFRTFARWVTDWYGTLDKLDVELSPEVTAVMDRMLVSQKEIEAAQERAALNPLFSEKPALMTDEEWHRLQLMAGRSVEEAEQRLRAQTLKDLAWLQSARSKVLKKMQAAARSQRAKVRKRVEKEVNDLPIFRLLEFVRKGVVPEGFAYEGGFKLHVDDVRAILGKDADLTKLSSGRWGILTKNRDKAADLRLIANMMGFKEPAAMVRQMMKAPDRVEYIEQQTDAVMAQDYQELTDPAKWEEAANEAVQSKLRQRVKRAELKALEQALTGKERDRISTKFFTEDNRAAVELVIGRMKNTRLNPKQFIGAAKRAGDKAQRALARDDLAGAVTAKRDQIFNMMIAEELYRVQKRRDKMIADFKRVMQYKEKTGSRQFDIVLAAKAILFSYGVNTRKKDALKYLETVQDIDPTLYNSINSAIAEHLADRNPDGSAKTINDLSMDNLTSLHEVVMSLYDQALAANTVMQGGKKLQYELVKNEIASVLKKSGAQFPEVQSPDLQDNKRKINLGFMYGLSKVENWVRVVEGPKAGPIRKYIVDPVIEAAAKYRLEAAVVVKRYRDAIKKIENTLTNEKIAAPELGPGVSFTNKAQLLHAMLHTGNASNKRKLLLGFKWAEEVTRPPKKNEKGPKKTGKLDTSKWDAFVSRMEREGILTKEDYEFLSDVWSIFRDMKGPAQEVFRRMNGRYFLQETDTDIVTRYGTFKGGYVPIEYNWRNIISNIPDKSERQRIQEQRDNVDNNAFGGLDDQSFFPSKAPGFTEKRTEFIGEIRLNLNSLHRHMDHQLRYIHLFEPSYNAHKLITDGEISTLLDSKNEGIKSTLLLPWIKRSAMQQHYARSKGMMGGALDSVAIYMRNVTSIAFMMFNIANAVLQFSGIALAMAVVNPKFVGESLGRVTGAMFARDKSVSDFIEESSIYMKDRRTNFRIIQEQEIGRIIQPGSKAFKAFRTAQEWAERNTYLFQVVTQNYVDAIVWDAAYREARSPDSKMKEKDLGTSMSHEEAVIHADSVVRRTQGSVGPETSSALEASSPMMRLFLHFWSYMNNWANLLGERAQNIKGSDATAAQKSLKFLYLYVMGFAIPSAVARVINNTMMQRWEEADNDEDEEIGWDEVSMELVRGQVADVTGMIPFVGQFVGGLLPEAVTPRLSSKGVVVAPAFSFVQRAATGLSGAAMDAINMDGEFDDARAIKAVGDLATFALRMPVEEATKRVAYFVDVMNGDTEPTGTIDYLHSQIITGRESEAAGSSGAGSGPL